MLSTMLKEFIKLQGEGAFVLSTVLAQQKVFIAKPEYSLMSPAQAQEALGQLIVALIHNKHKRKQFEFVCE